LKYKRKTGQLTVNTNLELHLLSTGEAWFKLFSIP